MAEAEKGPESWHPWVVSIVVFFLFLGLVTGWKTSETVAFMALVIVWNLGIIDTHSAISGFTNTGVLAVGVLFVVIQGVERSGIALRLARNAFGMKAGVRFGLFRLCLLCFTISGFLNNTPVVALLTPITRDWARTRGFSPSTFLIPLSYSTIFGGLLTTVGTSTNLVVLGLAEDMNLKLPGFFDIAIVGLPVGLVGIAYLVAFGPILLPKTGGMFKLMKDRHKDLITEVQVLKGFRHIGQPVALALAMVGLHRDSLVKIRRPLSKGRRLASASEISLTTTNSATEEHDGSKAPSPVTAEPSGAMSEGSRVPGFEAQISEGAKVPGFRSQAPQGATELTKRKMSASLQEVSLSVPDSEGSKKKETVRRTRTIVRHCHGVEEQWVDIFPVSANETLQEGDVLFLSGGPKHFITLHKGIADSAETLKVLDTDPAHLAGEGMDFVEVVIGNRNPFVGDSVATQSFGQFYGLSILAVRRKGREGEAVSTIEPKSPSVRPMDRQLSGLSMGGSRFSVDKNRKDMPSYESLQKGADESGETGSSEDDEEDAAETDQLAGNMEVACSKLTAGDVVLALAPEGFSEKWESKDDFLMITRLGAVPPGIRLWDYIPVAIFAAMITWVALDDNVNMVQAAMAAAAFNIFGGWVDAKGAVSLVPWDLLLLIGSMLGLSHAIDESGLADMIGDAIKEAGIGAHASLFLVYGITNVLTELTTNNAAAGLIFPISVKMSSKIGVSYMPFFFCVMCAASASFMTPIGYQTNLMVWGPGGYKFTDFTKIGAPLSMVYMIGCCLLIPIVWPFNEGPVYSEGGR